MKKTYYSDFYPYSNESGVVGTTMPALTEARVTEMIEDIGAITDDSVLTTDEKIRILIPLHDEVELEYDSISSQAISFGLNIVQLNAARSAWISYLNSLTPAWDDESQNTAIDRDIFRQKINEYLEHLAIIQANNNAEAARRADVDGGLTDGGTPINRSDVITREGTSNDTANVSGVSSSTLISRLTSTEDISSENKEAVANLQIIYGDTVNSATNAANSAAAAAEASQAKADAIIAKGQAQTSASDAAQKATDAAGSASATLTSKNDAAASATTATQKATDAAGSASTATTQAGLAANSATAAGGSATAAAGSASTATTKATEAGNSATAASASKVAAESAKDAAAGSATAAASSASSAATSATNAGTSASAANQSKLDAETARAAASVSATNAANSATGAAGSASTASTAAGVATTARDAAGASATAAGTSATNAASSATDAGISATAATTASVTASTASAAAQVAAIATFPNVIVADLFSSTVNGVAPGAKPSIPAALVSNGIFTPPTGSGGTLGFKQYLPWVPGFIFEITAIFDAPAGSDPAGYGRLFAIRAGADYGSLGTYYRPVAAVAPGAEVTQTVRYGMGVTPVGGVQIAPTAGLTWVSIGAQINLNADATGGQAGAKGRIKALIVRDVTAQAGAEGSASAAATSASNASASETASGQSASAAQTAATTATTKAGEASTSATAASTSAANASASETAAGQSSSAAQTAATTATTKAGEASTSASSASTSATNAAGSASTAATQAGLAAGSRDAAAGSASAAAGSASTATTKAGEAGTSAAAASASQVSASTARDRAAESASNASYLDVGAAFTFANTVDGWGAADGSLSPSPSGARFVQSGSDPQLIRSGLAILGSRYTRVIVNLTRTKARASGTWDGNLYYATDSHSFSDSFRQIITRDPAVGERTELTWDMPNLPNGGTDWLTSTIRVIRLDLDQGPGGEFTIHGVRVVGSDAAAPAKSASAAATSASLASASETAAGQSAAASAGSATAANTKAGEASTFASQASTSASNAAGSATTASTASGVAVSARDQANTARDAAQGSAATALTQAANASASASSASISANLAAQAGIGSLNKNPTFADWPTGQSLPNNIGSFGSVTISKTAGKVSSNAVTLEVASGVSQAGVEVAWTQTNWNGRVPAIFGQDNYWVIDYKIEVGTGGFQTSSLRFLLTDANNGGANASATVQPLLTSLHTSTGDDQIVEGSHFFKCNPTVNTPNYSARLAFFARGAAVANYGRYVVHKLAPRPATPAEIAAGVALPATQAQLQITAGVAASVESRMATAAFEVVAASGGDPAQLLVKTTGSTSLVQMVASALRFGTVVGGQIVETMKMIAGEVFITGPLYLGPNKEIELNPLSTSPHISIKVGAGRMAFGRLPNDNLIYWFGPTQTIANMRKNNATEWRDTTGNAYFGGALSAGTLKNTAQTSSTAALPETETAVFGSNGGTISVVLSFAYESTGQASGYNPRPSNTSGANTGTVKLYRKVGTGAYVEVATLSPSGDRSQTYTDMGTEPGEPNWSGMFYSTLNGSITFTDNLMTTQNRQYKAVVTAKSAQAFTNITQRLGIIATEG